MATDSLHLPRLLFWLQFIAKERQTARPHLLLFCVLVFFMSGGPADLEQSGNGELWIPSDLLQFLSQHSWIKREPICGARVCVCTSVYLDTPGGRVPVRDTWLRKETERLPPGDPWRSENYSEFSSQGSGSLSSRVCWSTFKHIH